jgi:hypothetical protein
MEEAHVSKENLREMWKTILVGNILREKRKTLLF